MVPRFTQCPCYLHICLQVQLRISSSTPGSGTKSQTCPVFTHLFFFCPLLYCFSWVSPCFIFSLKQREDKLCGTELQFHHMAASPPSAKTRLTSAPFSCHSRQFCTLLSGGDKVTLLPCTKCSREGGACWSFPDLSAPDIVQHQSLPNPDGKIIGVRHKRCLLTANSHSVS